MSQTRRVASAAEVARHDVLRDLIPISQIFSEQLGPMAVVAASLDKGMLFHTHWHDWAQLVFTVDGVMSVITDEGFWVVPPNRAVWIPALKKHSFQIRTALEMRTLYIRPDIAAHQPDHCCVLHASPLLREIINQLLEYPLEYGPDSPQARLTAVVLDEMEAAPRSPLHVPWPTSSKLQTIANYIKANPSDNRTLAEWGVQLGASERTLARQFRQDIGMSFTQWRQQARLVMALQLLAESMPVTQVAIELGYESPSAFISMFRKCLGTTPSRYFG